MAQGPRGAGRVFVLEGPLKGLNAASKMGRVNLYFSKIPLALVWGMNWGVRPNGRWL